MRRQIFPLTFLFVCLLVNSTFAQIQVVTGNFDTFSKIPNKEDEIGRYPISISETGIIAEVTVSINLEHPKLKGIDIFLKHNNQSVILFSGQRYQPPIGGNIILNVRYDDPDQTVTPLNMFSGLEASGEWILEIKDYFFDDGAYGVLKSWQIEVEMARIGDMEIKDEYDIRYVRLFVDAYGSFGDYSIGNSPIGAYHKIESSKQGNTVYASALMLHSIDGKEGRYLTSFDSFPGARLPSVPLEESPDGEWDSWFTIGSLDVYLHQKFEREQPEGRPLIFRLIQDYEFTNQTGDSKTYFLSRYINPKFRFNSSLDTVDNENYFLPHYKESLNHPELYVFDSIRDGTASMSPYVGIGAQSNAGDYYNYRVDKWYYPNGSQFDDILLNDPMGVYDWIEEATAWNDFDGDSLTDIDNGFDVALALGTTLSFDESQRVIRYVAITQWGYASPGSIMSVTEGVEYPYPTVISTPTLIPSTPTPSPTPTNTPTPTNEPAPPRWIKDLPDIRLIENQLTLNILNLEDYVYDPDTPMDELIFDNWDKDVPVPLFINSDNILSCSPGAEIGDYGEVTFFVRDDYNEFITQKVRVKVSSFLTESFRPAPPIVIAPGETSYTSPYRLNDLIDNYNDFPEGSFEWNVIEPLPMGVERISINQDSSFSMTVASDFSGEMSSLPFIVRRLNVSGTPTPTSTFTPLPPTPTFSPEPTATLTPTNSPTQTSTPIPPTSTSTHSPTQTATDTPTRIPPTSTYTPRPSPTNVPPSPTFTPVPKTPSPTLPPASTPTPSGPTMTPTPGCADVFAFPKIVASDTGMGPVDWAPLPGEGRADRIVAAHYDRGGIGIYQKQNGQYQSLSNIETLAGIANLSFGDFSGDSVEELFALNTAQETLSVFLADGQGNYQLGPELDLSDERLSDIYDIENGLRHQSLAVGRINSDSLADAAVRTRDSILLVYAQEGQLNLAKRIDFEGVTRLLKGCDLEGDGDLDLIVSVRTPQAEERVFVYQNQGGEMVLTQALRTDLKLKGNYPDELIARDLDGDNILDLVILGFSGSVQRFKGSKDGTFALTIETNPFPLGDIVAFDVTDLDLDGNSDLVALHRSQDGLVLFAVCGDLEYGRAAFPIGSFAPNGEMYVLKCMDTDGDGDPDILFTRNFQDSLVWIENGVVTAIN